MLTSNFPGRKNERRLSALTRLEAQLSAGTKPAKRSHGFHGRTEALTDDDRARIRREADGLSLRLKPAEVARAIRTKKDRSGTGRLSRAA